jgi:hypothetical protein
VNHALAALGHRLATLRSDFAALGTRAAGAAEAMGATLPPPSALLDELTAARAAFTQLRTAMVEHAGALAIVLDADELGTLRDLEPVLAAIAAAEQHRARLAAWDTARHEALGVLDRVTALVHREDRSLPILGECHSRARELRGVLAGPAPESLEEETALLAEKIRPYTELLALVDGWNVLDDDRCATLQDAVTGSFGRPLALAALRGKIGREGEAPPSARTPARAPAHLAVEPPPAVAATRVAPAPVNAPPRVAPPSPPPLAPPVPVAPPVMVPEARAVPAAAAAPATSDSGGTLLENPGLGGDAVAAQTPAPRREQVEELERLAQETAPWWIAARTGWQELRDRGLTFGDAARDYLTRFPYLLSVPLQKSAEYEGGRLAEGYALLLTHIDKQEQGFVKGALTRLNPQLGTRDKDQVYPLGQELYLYVVAEGRLYKTYPDFVREVVTHAVPKPGGWVQGGIVEADDETRLFMRSEQPGGSEEQRRTLTERKERLGPHLFRVTLGPLTTRFFTLGLAGDALTDPPNVEIKLKENDSPTDHAWLVVLPAPGEAQIPAPRKHRTGGTTLEELGKQFSGFWMGIFNADAKHDRHYELSIILRRKPPPISGPSAKPAPGPDRFFGKNR